MILYSYKNIWDKISIISSIACAIHCVALPLFFTTLPLFGIEIMENKWLELVTIFTSLLIGGWAVVNGYLKFHKNKNVVLLFVVGIIVMLVSNFVEIVWIEIISKCIAASCLITAHTLNWKKCKHCSVCNNINQ
jgi:cation transport ATPase